MFQLFKRKPNLAAKVASLAQCGICLNPPVTADSLLRSCSCLQAENSPYEVLLSCMGDEAVDVAPSATAAYRSDQIWHFDTECIHGPGSYQRITHRMAVLAQGELPVQDVHDSIDQSRGKAALCFTLDGKRYEWEAKFLDDWADSLILYQLAELMIARKSSQRFTYIDLGEGQHCLIGCATIEQKEKLAFVTGLPVQWLTKARATHHR